MAVTAIVKAVEVTVVNFMLSLWICEFVYVCMCGCVYVCVSECALVVEIEAKSGMVVWW